jgi:putative flippase GtrA
LTPAPSVHDAVGPMPAPSDHGRLGMLADPSEPPTKQPSSPGLRTDGDDSAGPEDSAAPEDYAGPEVVSSDPSVIVEASEAKHSLLYWLVDAHWLGRWRTPALLKLWRYGAGSVVAFVSSVVVYYIFFSFAHLGAIGSTWVAFVAGAIPNWILNRRWAWEKKGRDGVGRESALYVLVSVVSLAASSATTKATALAVVHTSHTARDLLVTFSYMASVVVLSVLKYMVYDRFVFIDRRKAGTAGTAVE